VGERPLQPGLGELGQGLEGRLSGLADYVGVGDENGIGGPELGILIRPSVEEGFVLKDEFSNGGQERTSTTRVKTFQTIAHYFMRGLHNF